MYGAANGLIGGSTKGPRKEAKISFVFRRTAEEQHCAGINSLLLGSDGETLYTASRDSTVRRWQPNGEGYACDAQYSGHVDWVNDIVLLGDLLASCSFDKTIHLWDTAPTGCQEPIATFVAHRDYITALASAPRRQLLASGGLGGEVYLWDVATATQLGAKGGYNPLGMQGVKESAYAVAMNEEGTLVAAGTTGRVIRVADSRTGAKVLKLRGHTDNVRSVLLNRAGTMALSGSSDHSVRLWDLGQQRCVHTFVVHSDSVWTLAASGSWDVVYSGGKDKCVYRTNVTNRKCELLLQEREPVRRLALSERCGRLAVATPASSVHVWSVDPGFPPSPTLPIRVDDEQPPTRAFLAGASTLHRARQVFETGPVPPAQQRAPAATIAGLPPLVQSRMLTDRRHVLTQDAEGEVALWDVTSGSCVESYGRVDISEKEHELFLPMSVSSWVSLDTKLGCLSGHLEPPGCFLAEIYAQDLGLPDVADDLKLNFGEQMLKGLFARWAAARIEAEGAVEMEDGREPPPNGDEAGARAAAVQGLGGDGDEAAGTAGVVDGASCAPARPQPFEFAGSPLPPALLLRSADGTPWRRLASELTGHEPEGSLVPLWVADCVLCSKVPASKEMKTAFVLTPCEGSNLPALAQARLNAPRVLRMHKVVSYAISKLAEANINLAPYPLHIGPQPPPLPAGEADAPREQPALELLCNNMAVPYDMSLAAVKQYMWKRSEELLLHYRIRDPRSPAQLPVIKRPS